jgi:hypothetical protein
MRRLRLHHLTHVALLAASACSFHSLDYLSAGGPTPGDSGEEPVATGGIGSSSGSVTGGVAPTARGGSETQATAAGVGGEGDAGAGGTQPGLTACVDRQRNLEESDVDCGGRSCDPCADGLRCASGADCESGVCTAHVCQPPSCTDLASSGDETDLNCGGECPPCALGLHCSSNADCVSSQCTDGVCQSATCQDGELQDGCPLLVDNTPYELSPSHALTSCLDDMAYSVADGTGMILWSCKLGLQQTFWSMAEADGYFAFRNALSGKCLQVRGASLAEGAVIEQSACDHAPEQLWKPNRIDSSLMELVSKVSGMALDVAGTNVGSNGRAIVQGAVNGSADTRWRLRRRTAATHVALSPYEDQSLRVRHSGAIVTVTLDISDSTDWKIVAGLADAHYVSFQSRDQPGRYLRRSDSRLWSDINDGSSQFTRDATFELAAPLVGDDLQSKSLRPFDSSDQRAQLSGDQVILPLATDLSSNAATWWIRPG